VLFAGVFFRAVGFFRVEAPFAFVFLAFAFVATVFFAALGRDGRAPGWAGAGPVALALRAGAPVAAGAMGGPPFEGAPSQNLISPRSPPCRYPIRQEPFSTGPCQTGGSCRCAST